MKIILWFAGDSFEVTFLRATEHGIYVLAPATEDLPERILFKLFTAISTIEFVGCSAVDVEKLPNI